MTVDGRISGDVVKEVHRPVNHPPPDELAYNPSTDETCARRPKYRYRLASEIFLPPGGCGGACDPTMPRPAARRELPARTGGTNTPPPVEYNPSYSKATCLSPNRPRLRERRDARP
jgi:hypothetical protein